MSHSFRSHYYHVIWSTKNRKNLISVEIQSRLYAYMGGIIRTFGSSLLSIGGTANHVHLLIAWIAPDKFYDIIRTVKSRSSLWVRETFNCPNFAWQEGYGSFTVGYPSIERVKNYINNQEKHHKILTFDEEYRKILKQCEIKLDERLIMK